MWSRIRAEMGLRGLTSSWRKEGRRKGSGMGESWKMMRLIPGAGKVNSLLVGAMPDLGLS